MLYHLSVIPSVKCIKEVSSHRKITAFRLQTPGRTPWRRFRKRNRNPDFRGCRKRKNQCLHPAFRRMCKAGAKGHFHRYRRSFSFTFQADCRGKCKGNCKKNHNLRASELWRAVFGSKRSGKDSRWEHRARYPGLCHSLLQVRTWGWWKEPEKPPGTGKPDRFPSRPCPEIRLCRSHN